MDLINRAEVHDLIAKRLSDYLTDESRKELEELDIKVEEDIPTVQAVPIEVLQELRKRISDLYNTDVTYDNGDYNTMDSPTLDKVLEYIDNKIEELSE